MPYCRMLYESLGSPQGGLGLLALVVLEGYVSGGMRLGVVRVYVPSFQSRTEAISCRTSYFLVSPRWIPRNERKTLVTSCLSTNLLVLGMGKVG